MSEAGVAGLFSDAIIKVFPSADTPAGIMHPPSKPKLEPYIVDETIHKSFSGEVAL